MQPHGRQGPHHQCPEPAGRAQSPFLCQILRQWQAMIGPAPLLLWLNLKCLPEEAVVLRPCGELGGPEIPVPLSSGRAVLETTPSPLLPKRKATLVTGLCMVAGTGLELSTDIPSAWWLPRTHKTPGRRIGLLDTEYERPC